MTSRKPNHDDPEARGQKGTGGRGPLRSFRPPHRPRLPLPPQFPPLSPRSAPAAPAPAPAVPPSPQALAGRRRAEAGAGEKKPAVKPLPTPVLQSQENGRLLEDAPLARRAVAEALVDSPATATARPCSAGIIVEPSLVGFGALIGELAEMGGQAFTP